MAIADARQPEALAQAGASALAVADQYALDIGAIEAQILGLNELLHLKRQRRGAWAAGGAGEQRMVRVLVGMEDAGWHVLADRRWPDTKHANIDVLLVGPGGVFVIDVKNWQEARIEGKRLWRGNEPQDDAVDKLLAQAAAVESLLAEEGLPASEVVPLLALARRSNVTARLGRVVVCGERDLARDLTRCGLRLGRDQVERLVKALDAGCPPHSDPLTPARPRAAAPRHRRPSLHTGPEVEPAPVSEREIVAALREAAAREPIESWMTWLHPSQAKLVAQQWSGPARIRGAAGTGKTVVALHRARHLALAGRRVLFTSFVKTLPEIHSEVFSRLAPEAKGKVEFRGIHSWSIRLLDERGIQVKLGDSAIKTCFELAWDRAGRGSAISALGVDRSYWREEIQSVIKGRGLTTFEQYAPLTRVGRRTPLQPLHREAVWALFTEYERLRFERGLHDWADVLLLALESVRAQPLQPGYDAVIVDEVQDLSSVGVQLLHALVGDAPDGLLLVGDGQQAVYPGGFSLAEAGVSVVGRSTVLRRNYRNGGDILRAALAVVADDAFDDLELERLTGVRDVDVERSGGQVVSVTADDAASQRAALVEQVRDAHDQQGVRLGDMAILCASNAVAAAWQVILEGADVPSMLLSDYGGRTTDRVKVGTFQRAKGLEFAYVLIPDFNRVPAGQRRNESDETYRERAELERRQLFVAMTRARDGLWLGSADARRD